jgi:hypothetical protein
MTNQLRPFAMHGYRAVCAGFVAIVIMATTAHADAAQATLLAPPSVPDFPSPLQRAVYRSAPAVESGWSWYVVVGGSSTCEGQQTCMAASVLGAPRRAHGPGKIVKMAGGPATYVPMQCHGAGCEPATLTFDRGAQTLRVAMRTGSLTTLERVASSLKAL